ncbi:MAG: DNA repair protein RadC [Anaerolineaceae bacterium]|nr:DNA repair protein RadC [Anaerolineaceae bacterium]
MPPDTNQPQHFAVNRLPDSERPRERLLTHGAKVLSNTELLAILLRTGTAGENVLHLAERILAHYGGLNGLAGATLSDLEQFNGLGQAKIAQVAAALELGRRAATSTPEERPQIHSASDAIALVNDMRDLQQEHVRVILLDSQRRVVAIPTVYIGTLNTSVLRAAEIFREAITRNCPALILAHNHPSGDPSPSPEDIQITQSLLAAGKLLDIQLLDHIIIGQRQWVSLQNLGLLHP